jgi:hypothetical protein
MMNYALEVYKGATFIKFFVALWNPEEIICCHQGSNPALLEAERQDLEPQSKLVCRTLAAS